MENGKDKKNRLETGDWRLEGIYKFKMENGKCRIKR
jgi:hypothetical protein